MVDTNPDHDPTLVVGWVSGRRRTRSAVVLAAVLQLLRQEGHRSWDTIWAEDGFVYMQQARDHGPLAVLLEGYRGYLQLPSRVIVAGSSLVPVAGLAAYAAITSSLVCAILATAVYRYTRGWIRSPWVRLAVAASMVLTPALGDENTANITNSIWTFTAALPWVILAREEGRKDVVARSLVASLAATATAISLLFAPLALGWMVVRRTRASRIVAAAYVAGSLLQLAVMSQSSRPPTSGATRRIGRSSWI